MVAIVSERNSESFEITSNRTLQNVDRDLGKYCLMACIDKVELGQQFDEYPPKHITIIPPFEMDSLEKRVFDREFSSRSSDQGRDFIDSYLIKSLEGFGDGGDVLVFRLFPSPIDIYARASFILDEMDIARKKQYGLDYYNATPIGDISILCRNFPKPHIVQQDGLEDGQHIQLSQIQLFESDKGKKTVCSIYNSDGSYEAK